MALTKKHHAAIALAVAESGLDADARLTIAKALAGAMEQDGMSKGFDRRGFIALATINQAALDVAD